MPMWNDLDRALAGSGLTVKIGYSGWKTYGHGTPGAAQGVVCHHTAGPPTGDTPSLNTVVYGRSDLPGPLCNLYLSRSGEVYLVAAGIGYHAGNTVVSWGDNDSGIGIEAEATGVDKWPQAQYDAYARLCASLAAYYRIPLEHVAGHKEVCSPPGRKIDPNFDMNAFRTAVGQGGGVPAASAKDFPDDEENRMLFLFTTVMTDPGKPAIPAVPPVDPDPGDPDADPPIPPTDGSPGSPAVPAVAPKYRYDIRGQRTCEAGGGSNIAQAAWVCVSSAWGGCNVSIAALNGKGGVTWVFGAPGKPARLDNNRQIPFPLPEGSRAVTVEGTRDNEGTIIAADVYNLR
jgi:N-acetylmuramoyl-L-alanine amidase